MDPHEYSPLKKLIDEENQNVIPYRQYCTPIYRLFLSIIIFTIKTGSYGCPGIICSLMRLWGFGTDTPIDPKGHSDCRQREL